MAPALRANAMHSLGPIASLHRGKAPLGFDLICMQIEHLHFPRFQQNVPVASTQSMFLSGNWAQRQVYLAAEL
jgi:hypothetical protein